LENNPNHKQGLRSVAEIQAFQTQCNPRQENIYWCTTFYVKHSCL